MSPSFSWHRVEPARPSPPPNRRLSLGGGEPDFYADPIPELLPHPSEQLLYPRPNPARTAQLRALARSLGV